MSGIVSSQDKYLTQLAMHPLYWVNVVAIYAALTWTGWDFSFTRIVRQGPLGIGDYAFTQSSFITKLGIAAIGAYPLTALILDDPPSKN